MFSYLPLIFRNTVRNRRRSALTIASVAVSLCLLAVLMALYRALFYGAETTPGQAMRLVVHHKISLTEDLPVAYEEKIKQIPGVQSVTSLRWFGGTYKDARETRNHSLSLQSSHKRSLRCIRSSGSVTTTSKLLFPERLLV